METEIELSAAARLDVLRIGGRYPSPETVRQWIVSGLKLSSGERVRLPATRRGGRWTVAPSAVATFVMKMTADRLNPARAGEPALVSA